MNKNKTEKTPKATDEEEVTTESLEAHVLGQVTGGDGRNRAQDTHDKSRQTLE